MASEAEGRQAVIALKRSGADFIKVYSRLSRDAYFAIADEAGKQGLPFVGHIPDSVSAEEASAAGQKSLEHFQGGLLSCSNAGDEIRRELVKAALNADPSHYSRAWVAQMPRALSTYDEEKAARLFARLVKNGAWVVPTLYVTWASTLQTENQAAENPLLKYIPRSLKQSFPRRSSAEYLAIVKPRHQKQLEVTGAMRRAGVALLAGTDAGPYPNLYPGFALHDELGLLVQAGLTPLEALQAATRNPARFLGLEQSLGTIEKGKIADLVLLEANPLRNIGNTRKISAVVVQGRLLDRATLDQMLAEVEVAASRK